MARPRKPNSEKAPITHAESMVNGVLANGLEGGWRNGAMTVKYSYDPNYCKMIKDFYEERIQRQQIEDTDPESKRVIAPAHRSQFARSIGVPTSALESWAKLFPDFREALQTAEDIHREMLIDGGLTNKFNPKITSILLDVDHGIREKKESLLPEGVGVVPLSAIQSINYLLKQQGQQPVAIDAEFTEIKNEGG